MRDGTTEPREYSLRVTSVNCVEKLRRKSILGEMFGCGLDRFLRVVRAKHDVRRRCELHQRRDRHWKRGVRTFVVLLLEKLGGAGGIEIRPISRHAILDTAGKYGQHSAGMNDDESHIRELAQDSVPQQAGYSARHIEIIFR